MYDYSSVDYVGALNGVKIQCKEHSTFTQSPASHLSGRGCPKCSKYGFDQSKPSELYVYKFTAYYGFGITNNFDGRHKDHALTFSRLGVNADLVKTYKGSGEEIYKLESLLKTTLPIVNTNIPGFKTEAIEEHNGLLLFRTIDDFFKQQPAS